MNHIGLKTASQYQRSIGSLSSSRSGLKIGVVKARSVSNNPILVGLSLPDG